MATVKSIAAAVGVSPSVVSAVLNGSTHVRMSEATRQAILAKIDELGYTPNLAARSLRTAKSGVLAVVAPKLSNPVLAPMFDGIHDAAEECGYAVMLADADRLVQGSRMLDRILGNGQVDGTILRPSGDVDSEGIRSVLKREAPIVVLDEVPNKEQNWLAIDDVAAGRVVTEHLLARGHRRIGFLGGWLSNHNEFRPPQGFRHSTLRRLEGYHAALLAAGIQPSMDNVIQSDHDAHSGYGAMEQFMELADRPTALVVNNATTSIGVLAGAMDAGLRVPEDLALAAIHDIDVMADVRPSISGVQLPMYELGHRGVMLLDKVIRGERVVSGVIADPKPRMTVRGSS